MASVWETLSKVDVSDHTEDKNGLTYLSWAWAWGTKKHYPNATFRKNLYGSENSMIPYMVDPAVMRLFSVTVTIEGEEQTEVLPVLNHANKAVSAPDSFQVNTALQRCLAKCCAMHGLGHYIYAGEDLPEGVEKKVTVESAAGGANRSKALIVALRCSRHLFQTATASQTVWFWASIKTPSTSSRRRTRSFTTKSSRTSQIAKLRLKQKEKQHE